MVTRAPYVPDEGHIVWLTLDPSLGHEQRGRRPALVLSPAKLNKASGLAIVCPVTSQVKGYPFEIPVTLSNQSVILVDHVRSVDWKVRRAEKFTHVTQLQLAEVRKLLKKILGM